MNPRFFNAHNATCDRKQMTQEEEEDDDGDESFWQCSGREGTKNKPRILGMCCRFTVCGWKKGVSKKARARSLNE